jgi:hypothetical protein
MAITFPYLDAFGIYLRGGEGGGLEDSLYRNTPRTLESLHIKFQVITLQMTGGGGGGIARGAT